MDETWRAEEGVHSRRSCKGSLGQSGMHGSTLSVLKLTPFMILPLHIHLPSGTPRWFPKKRVPVSTLNSYRSQDLHEMGQAAGTVWLSTPGTNCSWQSIPQQCRHLAVAALWRVLFPPSCSKEKLGQEFEETDGRWYHVWSLSKWLALMPAVSGELSWVIACCFLWSRKWNGKWNNVIRKWKSKRLEKFHPRVTAGWQLCHPVCKREAMWLSPWTKWTLWGEAVAWSLVEGLYLPFLLQEHSHLHRAHLSAWSCPLHPLSPQRAALVEPRHLLMLRLIHCITEVSGAPAC